MAKKQKEEIPNVNSTGNRDIVQRLNFLYQASVYLQSIAPSSSETTTERDDTRKINNEIDQVSYMAQRHTQDVQKRTKRRNISKKSTADLARNYVQSMHVVSQKTTVKIDPSMKRTLCPNCCTTLVPGSSVSVRVKRSRSHGHAMVFTCSHCRHSKRIPAPEISPPASTCLRPSSPDAISNQNEEDPSSSAATVVPPLKTSPGTKSTKKRSPVRQSPLFARLDAGHAIFRGNDQHPIDPQSGFGMFLV